MSNLKQIASPDLSTILTQLEEDLLTSINVHRIGTVVNTANAIIEVRLYDIIENTTVRGATIEKYPLLKCLWIAPKNMIAMLDVGDVVLVGFNDVSLSNVIQKRDQQRLQSSRKHDFSDGIILGVVQRIKPNEKAGFSMGEGSNAVEMSIGDNSGAMVNAGSKKVAIKNKDTNMKAVQEAIVDISDALITALDSFKSLGTGNMGAPVNSVAVPGQTADAKAKIQAALQKLGQLLE